MKNLTTQHVIDHLEAELRSRSVDSRLSGKELYIFGVGSFSKKVTEACITRNLEVSGFIVSVKRRNSFLGRPVFGVDRFNKKNAAIIVAVFNRDDSFLEIRTLLHGHGLENLYFPWDIYNELQGELGWQYWLSAPDYFSDNIEQLSRTFSRLADQKSKETLIATIRFRAGLDFVDANSKIEADQYFNKISMKTLFDDSITYVDGGAFLGQNLITLADYRTIKQAFLFEPDPKNFTILCGDKRLQSYDCYFLPLALCKENKLMNFQGGQGEASFAVDMGNTEVAAVALDQVMGSNKVDFLKLDVEGGEVNALIGAQKTINRSRPVLAISAYHRPDDLWVIPDLIMQINDGYDLFLRFHRYNTFELVLYAIPTR